jgi:hypothetical protein
VATSTAGAPLCSAQRENVEICRSRPMSSRRNRWASAISSVEYESVRPTMNARCTLGEKR